jgi:hypothetical protein
MPTTTLYLQREAGVEKRNVTWNGNVKDHWKGSHLQPTRRFLFEMEPEERAERLAELGAYHAD